MIQDEVQCCHAGKGCNKIECCHYRLHEAIIVNEEEQLTCTQQDGCSEFADVYCLKAIQEENKMKDVICVQADNDVCCQTKCLHCKPHKPNEICTTLHSNDNEHYRCYLYPTTSCVPITEEDENVKGKVKKVICIRADAGLCGKVDCPHYKLHVPRKAFFAKHLNCNQYHGCNLYRTAICIHVEEDEKREE